MADFAPPADAHPALLSTQRHLLLNQVIEHRAKIAELGRQQVQKEAEQATIAATVHKLETMFPVIQPGVDIRKTLMEKKLGSKLTYFETLQLLGRASALRRAICTRRRRPWPRFARPPARRPPKIGAHYELAKAEQKANGLTQDLIKAEQKTAANRSRRRRSAAARDPYDRRRCHAGAGPAGGGTKR